MNYSEMDISLIYLELVVNIVGEVYSPGSYKLINTFIIFNG